MNSRGSYDPRDHRPPGHAEGSQWLELRDLLTGPEQRQLAQILKRLNDPIRRAHEISKALPDAISLGVSRDSRIARALQPTIDTALKSSVHKNPKVIADAIFPALGPAIRKAISATLMGMVQSLNHVLNQSFSLQGLKWRLEALRTRKSFAEVVLLHTLVYRVEQIYLIHRHTGVLLLHAGTEAFERRDPDLISGMLTAIQDFVKDSFDAQSGEMLDTLRMDGDHSVWIEHGSKAIIAAVIRGTPPVDLRRRFRDLIERVHSLFGASLENFDGRTEAFDVLKPEFEDALTDQVRSSTKTISPWLWVLSATVVFFALFWGWRLHSENRHWQAFLSQLRSEQGIIVTAAEKRDGKYIITGLKDPGVDNIARMVAACQLDAEQISFHWQPFYALDNGSTLKRAVSILQPPTQIELAVREHKLLAKGGASHRWIKRFQRLAVTIAGVHAYDDTQLQDHEMMRLVSAIAALEKQSIYFEVGASVLQDNQKRSLMAATEQINLIQHLQQLMGETVKVIIIGQADYLGAHDFNLLLSRQRAQAVLGYLTNNGIEPVNMDIVGAGAKSLSKRIHKNKTRDVYRSVTFKAFINVE